VEGSFTRKRNYRSVGNKRTKRNGLKAQSSNESQLGNKCLNTEHQCSQYFQESITATSFTEKSSQSVKHIVGTREEMN